MSRHAVRLAAVAVALVVVLVPVWVLFERSGLPEDAFEEFAALAALAAVGAAFWVVERYRLGGAAWQRLRLSGGAPEDDEL